jgi:LemA protein
MGSLFPLIVLGTLVVLPIVLYNRLVALRLRFKNAFAQIDVQLKRRYDLVPNLVEVAKGYLAHERDTLEAVIAARSQAQQAERRAAASPEDASAMAGLSSAESALSGALGRLLAVSEAYPELRGNETMRSLQEELASTENRIAFARQAYNDAAMHYNTYRESFPQNQVAGTFGFQEAPLFEHDVAAQRQAPKVSFQR